MSVTIDQLKSEMSTLPANERAELAHFLIESLENGPEEGVEAAWEAELARRSEEILSGKVTGRPAEQVFAEIRARYS
jgi:putative addiction module component (TIGR02574 family)